MGSSKRSFRRNVTIRQEHLVCGEKVECMLLSNNANGDYLLFKKMAECLLDVPLKDCTSILGVSDSFFKKQIRDWIGFSWWPCVSILARTNPDITLESVVEKRLGLMRDLSVMGPTKRTNKLLMNSLRILKNVHIFSRSYSHPASKKKEERVVVDVGALGVELVKKTSPITEDFNFDSLFETDEAVCELLCDDELELGPLPEYLEKD